MSWQISAVQAGDDDLTWQGIIESIPNGAQRVGNWTVSGKSFIADNGTEFDEEDGDLTVGACAKVTYVEENGNKRAKEIDSEPADDCDGDDNGGGHNNEDLEWRGRVEAVPTENARVGEWTVRGRVFVADNNTEFDESEGPVELDACVKVDYAVQADGSYNAHQIESEPASDCNDNDDDNGNNGDDQKIYARVDAIPAAGFIGEWTIGGVVYTTDSKTYFEQEHGGLGVNACVKVEYVSGTPPLAKEIKTENSYKCDGQGSDDDDDDNSANFPKGELYGVIRSLPEDGLLGQWLIGSIAMTVTEQTKLETERGPFEVGVLVKAKFYTNDNDENIALKIESKYKTDDDGNDDDDNGSHEGKEGHAYGVIETIPGGTAGVWGTWTISGIDYLVGDKTKLEQGLAVGLNVKVKYYVNADDKRVAKRIRATDDDGSPSQPGHFKTYGFVDQKPADSLNGTWNIDGVSFVADQTTIFDDSYGVIVEGSYVEVEYRVVEGVNRLKKVEAHVPPGAGDDDKAGRLDSIGQLAAGDVSAGSATWVVDGVSYIVTDATALNDTNGDLVVGSTVTINSYTDAGGARIATLVNSVAVNRVIYLPAVAR